MDRGGWMLDVGKAELAGDDGGTGHWSGTLRVFAGSCLESKSLTALVELEDGTTALAQVGPMVSGPDQDLIAVKVVGIDPAPF